MLVHKLHKSAASQHPGVRQRRNRSFIPLLRMRVFSSQHCRLGSPVVAVGCLQCGNSVQLIGLLKYVHGSIWDSLGRMFNSPVCSVVTVEKGPSIV